jgi:hypothetical protein
MPAKMFEVCSARQSTEVEVVRGGSAGRVGAGALVLLAIGCVDSGLPGKNLPLEEARTRPFRYEVYEARAVEPVRIEDREWVAAGAPMQIPPRLLTPVTPDGNVFALTTDASPRSRLYLRSETGYIPLAPAP